VRKVKQIKEKDSLFNEIKFKSQAAMEYLMTYGWAILIIALTLAVLYSLGIMNPKNFLPRAPPGSCFVFRPNGPGTTDFVSLQGTCGYLPMYVASFDGVNSYVEIPNSNSLSVNTVTIAFWFKSTQVWNAPYWPGSATFISKATAGGASSDWTIIGGSETSGVNEGRIIAGFGYTNGGDYLLFSKPGKNDGRWHQCVVTSIQNGQMNLYIDGVLENSTTNSGGTITNTRPIQIGGDPFLGGKYLNGSIANIQIYNTALTPQEIQYLYQEGLGGGPVRLQNLVAWWPLNGDAKDYSGNNLHGTIYGGVTFVQNYNPP
jgi:hypothetical protein